MHKYLDISKDGFIEEQMDRSKLMDAGGKKNVKHFWAKSETEANAHIFWDSAAQTAKLAPIRRSFASGHCTFSLLVCLNPQLSEAYESPRMHCTDPQKCVESTWAGLFALVLWQVALHIADNTERNTEVQCSQNVTCSRSVNICACGHVIMRVYWHRWHFGSSEVDARDGA